MKYFGKNIYKCTLTCTNKSHDNAEDAPLKKGKGWHVRWWHGLPESMDTDFYPSLRLAKQAIKEGN